MRWRFLSLLAFILAASLSGCGAPTATVSGTVTVDGQPLDDGVISYSPAEGQGTPVTAKVEKGKYYLRTTPGEKWVQVSAPVVVGKASAGPGAPPMDITRERLPARYNAQTELKCTLQPSDNTKDWSLQTQAPQTGGR